MAQGGESKTEKATEKRRRDERKKGNIFQSKDVVTVVSLLAVFGSLKLLFPRMYFEIKTFIQRYIAYTETVDGITTKFANNIMLELVMGIFKVALPVMLIAILAAVIATVMQTRPIFVGESLKPKFSKLNPLKGLKNLFSLKSFVEVIKGIIKITILFSILYNFFIKNVVDFIGFFDKDILSSCTYILGVCFKLVMYASIAFVAISALDYLYQWWDYERQIKMSKHEVKEEYKQMEGDPQIKAKIKQTQRRFAMSRMMQAVPSADVVVKNPTHYAVALKYDFEKDAAPILVAKGQDELALRIIKKAEESDVVVVENVALARAIYATTDINRQIPPDFFGVVADILVYVYKIKGKKIDV